MSKPQRRSVQRKTLVSPRDPFPEIRSVAIVSKHRMLRFSKMHADLISSAGLQLHGHMSRIGQSFGDLVMSHCQLAIVFIVR